MSDDAVLDYLLWQQRKGKKPFQDRADTSSNDEADRQIKLKVLADEQEAQRQAGAYKVPEAKKAVSEAPSVEEQAAVEAPAKSGITLKEPVGDLPSLDVVGKQPTAELKPEQSSINVDTPVDQPLQAKITLKQPEQPLEPVEVGTQTGFAPLTANPAQQLFDYDQAMKPETDYKGDPELSKEFQTEVSPDLSVAGIQVPKATAAYDVASEAMNQISVANKGLLDTPMIARRIGAYLYKPYDAAFGTKLFEKHSQTTDQMEGAFKSIFPTKDPETLPERAMYALGASLLPIPGAPAATTTKGIIGQTVKEALLPGTIVRPGQSLAATYAVSAPGAVAVNEGLYQTLSKLDELRKTNPPVPNSKGELEPRVLSVGGTEAKELQRKIDTDNKTFIPQFTEANFGDQVFYGAAGAVALYGMYKGVRKFATSPVAGRTIVNPTKPIAEATPESATTATEALRTTNQNANQVLESKAKQIGDQDLEFEIATNTRSGLDARLEAMQGTGNVEVPGYSYQLKASPKAMLEQHLSRPQQEQQDLSWALHVMDQVDHAKLNSKRRAAVKAGEDAAEPEAQYATMPAQPDVMRAEQILAQPANRGMIDAMAEARIAIAKVTESSGAWDANTTQMMLRDRPNYVHNIETDDYKVVNGQTVPKSRWESFRDNLGKKQGVDDDIDPPVKLASSLERSRVNKPNQVVDAVQANLQALDKSVRFAYENDIRRRMVEGITADPDIGKSIMPLKEGQSAPDGYSVVSFFKNGEKQRFAAEPLFAEAMRVAPYRSNTVLNAANTLKNQFQRMTTGPLAPFFIASSYSMEAFLGAATRAKGLRLGWLDQAAQAASGGKIAVPGDALGAMGAMAVQSFKANRADSILQHANLIERALLDNPQASIADLEAAVPGSVKKIARGLSIGSDTSAQGLVDGAREFYEQTPKGWALKHGALHSSQSEMMRNVNEFSSKNVGDAFIQSLGYDNGGAWHSWFGKYLSNTANIHDAMRLTLAGQNKGKVPDNFLAYQMRRASGDLGNRGLDNTGSSYRLKGDTALATKAATKAITSRGVGSVLDAIRATTPYINPHVQGMTRFMEQMKRQPKTTLMGVFNATTIPQLASLGLAYELGPEYVDYLMNKREEWKKNGYLHIPIPGLRPEAGLEIRQDPVLSPFGYPILEVMNNLIGIRQDTAQKLDKAAPPTAEDEGFVPSFMHGMKEWLGVGYPLPVALGLASQGVAVRNMTDTGYAVKPEQVSDLGGGKNPASAMSVSTQMMLETALGALGQHVVAGMDAWVSTDPEHSAMASFAKGAGTSLVSKAPVVGGQFFGGQKYNQPGTTLAQNSRKLVDAARRITKAVELQEKQLLINKTDNPAEAKMQTPNLKQGYPGDIVMPDEVYQVAGPLAKQLSKSGQLGVINSERTRISTVLSGLRAVNPGNIGRHVIVPLKEGKEIGGLGYTILHTEQLKKELEAEEGSILEPKMVDKGKKKSAVQRPKPVYDMVGGKPDAQDNGKIKDPRGQYYRAPSLMEVNNLRNALGKRRYDLDLQAATALEQIEKDTGVKLLDVAKEIKLDPSQLGGED